MTPDVERIAASLTKAQRDAVAVMMAYDDSDTPCLSAKDLAKASGLPEPIARCAGKSLAASGLAECETGLVNSDGEFYGSGWHLTDLGLAVRTHLKENENAG